MEFCDRLWNFTKFAPKLYQICIFFVTTKKLSCDLKSPHFLTFSAKRRKFQIGQRDSHGKSRNGPGKVLEKYFVRSVGTLNIEAPTMQSACIVFDIYLEVSEKDAQNR